MLAVVYLIFNEGYTASSGDRLVREDLCAEAIRLGRLLAELMPDEPEVMGLLALMLLVESRRAARTTPDGDLVLLADQDRGRWDRGLVAEGQAIVRSCLRRNQPGPYQIQAAINAVHSDAPTAAGTDWRQVLQLYDQLLVVAPSPVVALNRAVAVAEVEGPDVALTLVDDLDLGGYYLFHAIRADLLRRLGRDAEAVLAYEAAIERSRERRRARLPAAQPAGAVPASLRRAWTSFAARRSADRYLVRVYRSRVTAGYYRAVAASRTPKATRMAPVTRSRARRAAGRRSSDPAPSASVP